MISKKPLSCSAEALRQNASPVRSHAVTRRCLVERIAHATPPAIGNHRGRFVTPPATNRDQQASLCRERAKITSLPREAFAGTASNDEAVRHPQRGAAPFNARCWGRRRAPATDPTRPAPNQQTPYGSGYRRGTSQGRGYPRRRRRPTTPRRWSGRRRRTG